ncbi:MULTISPECIES: glycoside hydrolase family 13 protein [Enterococcus]|uniref:Alpha-amylase n=1 Tax=Enterococcus mundtii TaxID=53346 RepID=A0ABQ0V8Y3_ENTMU|nr:MULTISPECIES: alpha-glucosidase [Enterococcus]GEN17225.1 alpha-amylase [Ligilactobacillus acidipiscis]AUB52645.1 glucohydrolase [Enterococcus mundtii]MZZ57427.1 alpha,alpha-phosphotrehalase [Enterococcus mundtii]MZZ60402.1 alpha,alpha-phosphotrehalase [Enterococcus mundtii]MZZ67387.1 alpha,alpha-phosphotrehalase [Enterococcus mundtii]
MKQSEKWWKEAVGYQIYPASFKDSNNDGIGDINGIRQKLSYLKELGIDFIWINPIYQSPFVDNGYDISDYQAILKKFGTMDEFDALLAEAHQMGIKIIMDLVINHSSDQHEWFIESRQSVDNPYRDYYIWVDGTPDQAPNEWQSIFGGSAWQYDEQTGQYYLHIFAKEQPDLNWESDKLKDELFTMIRWWLDKGIDGFRLDAISHVKKDEYSVKATENPFSPFQNVSGIEDHLTELKNVFDEYDIMTVGEASGVSASEGPEWVGENGYFDMIFEFDHISIWKHEKDGDLDVLSLKQSLSAWQRALDGKGWNALYMENHDVPRCVSVFGDTSPAYWQVSAKAIAMMYFFLQGTPFIYQGQEIGMTNLPFSSIDEIDAVDSKRLYQQLLDEGRSEEEALDIVANTTRDNSRTPMQWNDHLYAGFSEVAPWLLVNPNHQMINVADQTNDPESILSFYKKMIALRRENKGLVYGSFNEYLPENEQLFVYERVLEEERYLIIVNLTDEAATYTLPTEIKTTWEVLLENQSGQEFQSSGTFAPYEARLYRKI